MMEKTCFLEGMAIKILSDSGTSGALINLATIKAARLEERIEPTDRVFKDYNGNQVIPKGMIKTVIRWNSKDIQDTVYVTEAGRNLLSFQSSKRLGIIKVSNINYLRSIFCYSYYIAIKPNAKLIIQREQPVPFCIRPQVEEEINKLLDESLLAKSTQTDWVFPIVVVREKTGEIKLCGDFHKLN